MIAFLQVVAGVLLVMLFAVPLVNFVAVPIGVWLLLAGVRRSRRAVDAGVDGTRPR